MGMIAEIVSSTKSGVIHRIIERRKDPLARAAYEFGFTPSQRVASWDAIVHAVNAMRTKHPEALHVVIVSEDIAFVLLRLQQQDPWRTFKWYAAQNVPAYRVRNTLNAAIGS
jgi:hypothetical protein